MTTWDIFLETRTNLWYITTWRFLLNSTSYFVDWKLQNKLCSRSLFWCKCWIGSQQTVVVPHIYCKNTICSKFFFQ